MISILPTSIYLLLNPIWLEIYFLLYSVFYLLFVFSACLRWQTFIIKLNKFPSLLEIPFMQNYNVADNNEWQITDKYYQNRWEVIWCVFLSKNKVVFFNSEIRDRIICSLTAEIETEMKQTFSLEFDVSINVWLNMNAVYSIWNAICLLSATKNDIP